MLAPVNRNPDQRTLRQFGWIMLGGLAVLGLLLWWVKSAPPMRWTWQGSRLQWVCLAMPMAGACVLALSKISLPLTRALYVGWMTCTRPLGIVMGFVGLSVLYFLVLPVFAFIVRINDPMRRRLGRESSYWEPARPAEPTLDRLARPF